MIRLIVILGLVVTVLSSCDAVTPEQCEAGNWREIGLSDGKQGRSAGYVAEIQKACSKVGVTVDEQAWRAGREAGLKQYCTPQNAYKIGRNGTQLANVCTGPSVSELNAANIKGRKYYAINSEISSLRTRSSDIDTKIFFIGSTTDEEKLKEIRDLKREQQKIKTRISDLEIDKISYSAL